MKALMGNLFVYFLIAVCPSTQLSNVMVENIKL